MFTTGKSSLLERVECLWHLLATHKIKSVVLPHRLNDYLNTDINHMNAFNWEYGQQNVPLAPAEACFQVLPAVERQNLAEELRHSLGSELASFAREKEHRWALRLFLCVWTTPQPCHHNRNYPILGSSLTDKIVLKEVLYHRRHLHSCFKAA